MALAVSAAGGTMRRPGGPPRRSAPLVGALLVSIAAHVAAFVVLRAPAQSADAPRPVARLTVIAPQPGPLRAAAGSSGQATPATSSHVDRLPEVAVSAARERGPRPAAAPGLLTPNAATVVAATPTTEATPEVRAEPPIPLPAGGAPITGVGALNGFAIEGFGTPRARLFRMPAAEAAAIAVATAGAPPRAALEAQVAEARVVGALFTALRAQWSEQSAALAAEGRNARCILRRGTEALAPTLDCSATPEADVPLPAASRDTVLALLERFDCLAFERDPTGARVVPCAPEAARVAQARPVDDAVVDRDRPRAQ